MPTARELLEQADALMRRNRGVEDIPVLTDSVPEPLAEPALSGPATRERAAATLQVVQDDVVAADAAANAAESEALDLALERSIAESAEPPMLTDVVEEVAVDILPLAAGGLEEDPAPWLGPDTVDPALHSITGPSPDTVAVVPPVTLRAVTVDERPAPEEQPTEAIAPTLRAVGSAPTPAPLGSLAFESVPAEAADEERWRSLAEQISMQVLQRLDLFVDTGLKAQLAAHLQPIVARAGTELVEAINDHVGQLVRSYVAEAIEREIAQWRQGQR
ncbi:MAG TPA: hypothetical protein VL742_01530 [Casimicrobiaceae bacterium]|nr:hypothetical protein [Casimicrobiaceae bacterium]